MDLHTQAVPSAPFTGGSRLETLYGASGFLSNGSSKDSSYLPMPAAINLGKSHMFYSATVISKLFLVFMIETDFSIVTTVYSLFSALGV